MKVLVDICVLIEWCKEGYSFDVLFYMSEDIFVFDMEVIFC